MPLTRAERRAAGLCACGRAVAEGRSRCALCLERDAAGKPARRTKRPRVWCDECLACGTHLPGCKAPRQG